MSLNAPRLDDRSFQDLVDDAKRYVIERCKGWTDHNVSDPGVTLIEAFAWMTDLLLYRLNRVPERSYVKFLEMIGVTLRQPGAARIDVDFRLSASFARDITIPARTVVSTERANSQDPVLFTLQDDHVVRTARADAVLRGTADGQIENWTTQLGVGRGFPAFAQEPAVGDAVYLRFPAPVDRHLLMVSADCVRGEGHGIEPTRAPLRWEISNGRGWSPCDLIGADGTGGFNYSGHIELAVPADHAATTLGDIEGYWLRCVVVPSSAGQPPYRSSPRIIDLAAATIGVTAECVNAVPVQGENLGQSTGVPGQELFLSNTPVVMLSGEALLVESHHETAAGDNGDGGRQPDPEVWELRDNFADTGPDDRHFTLDATNGVIRFGPEIRQSDGSAHRFGRVPPKGSFLTVSRYWHGGGGDGNVGPGTIRSLRTAVPHVRLVRNRAQATGGVDGETIEEAKLRGPLEMRARNRAVTAEDFEYLARSVAPEIRQVKCVEDEDQPGSAAVRVLLVPDVRSADGLVRLEDLVPDRGLLERVAHKLDETRLVGTRVHVGPPQYVGIAIDTTVEVRPDADPVTVRETARMALNRYFNPVSGGEAGRGWPFGRGVRAGEAYGVLQQCRGVDVVLDLTIYEVDLESGDRVALDDGSLLLHPNELIVSVGHSVEIVA